jgi:hypothetical protein
MNWRTGRSPKRGTNHLREKPTTCHSGLDPESTCGKMKIRIAKKIVGRPRRYFFAQKIEALSKFLRQNKVPEWFAVKRMLLNLSSWLEEKRLHTRLVREGLLDSVCVAASVDARSIVAFLPFLMADMNVSSMSMVWDTVIEPVKWEPSDTMSMASGFRTGLVLMSPGEDLIVQAPIIP